MQALLVSLSILFVELDLIILDYFTIQLQVKLTTVQDQRAELVHKASKDTQGQLDKLVQQAPKDSKDTQDQLEFKVQ